MRRFSGRLVVAALAVVGGYAAARSLGLKLPQTAPQSTPAASTAGDVAAGEASGEGSAGGVVGLNLSGDHFIADVLAHLERWPNMAARFRQTVRVGDRPLAGLGEYWQQGVGIQRRTCWQWQTVVEGQKAEFAQVLDNHAYLWSDERFGDERTVTRVDINGVRRDLSLSLDGPGQGRAGGDGVGAAGDKVDELMLLARGGASQLIAELKHNFTFTAPVEVTENGQTLVAIVGRWRAERLARMGAELTPDSTAGWPEHLPHHVVVKAGRKNFFPYVIEYRRGADAALADSAYAVSDPLAWYEFFDVRWQVTMPDRLFEFTPAEADWRDVTQGVVQRLLPEPAAAPKVAETPGTWRQ